MKKLPIVLAFALFAFISFAQTPQEKKQAKPCDECFALAMAVDELNSIRPGDDRVKVREIFVPSPLGGFRPASPERWAYKKCPHIKVDFEFDKDGNVKSASHPYLGTANGISD